MLSSRLQVHRRHGGRCSLRSKDSFTYGILPVLLTVQNELRMHGGNARVPAAVLGWVVEYHYRVLFAVANR